MQLSGAGPRYICDARCGVGPSFGPSRILTERYLRVGKVPSVHPPPYQSIVVKRKRRQVLGSDPSQL